MYTRLILVNFGPGMRSTGEMVADTFAPIYKTMKGFKGATFFANHETGENGALSLWESKEDAEAATASLWPKLQELAGGMLKGPPTVRTFELYEPKVYVDKEITEEG
jgi:heme-degrading monooxygenase HmoA